MDADETGHTGRNYHHCRSGQHKEQECKQDPEMSSTRKGKQYYSGMKALIGVDSDSSLVYSLTGTEVRRDDSTQREALLHGEETVISDDKGYADEGFKKFCREEGVVYAICNKAKRNHPLSNGQKKRNCQLSSWRAKVEYPFQVIKCQWNYRKIRYKGLKKNRPVVHAIWFIQPVQVQKKTDGRLNTG